jgi:hypothetical protein
MLVWPIVSRTDFPLNCFASFAIPGEAPFADGTLFFAPSRRPCQPVLPLASLENAGQKGGYSSCQLNPVGLLLI